MNKDEIVLLDFHPLVRKRCIPAPLLRLNGNDDFLCQIAQCDSLYICRYWNEARRTGLVPVSSGIRFHFRTTHLFDSVLASVLRSFVTLPCFPIDLDGMNV
jgi:hypothetical protein